MQVSAIVGIRSIGGFYQGSFYQLICPFLRIWAPFPVSKVGDSTCVNSMLTLGQIKQKTLGFLNNVSTLTNILITCISGYSCTPEEKKYGTNRFHNEES